MVLDTIMAHGTVPILITKADNVEGNHQLNYIIAKLAYEYDLPLYNWWRAAQPLPYRGLDPETQRWIPYFHGSLDRTQRVCFGYVGYIVERIKG